MQARSRQRGVTGELAVSFMEVGIGGSRVAMEPHFSAVVVHQRLWAT